MSNRFRLAEKKTNRQHEMESNESLKMSSSKHFFIFFLFFFVRFNCRLAVHNMHYVSNVLGIRDPIHKQKIALKAMDVVLFGPPRGK